MLTVHKVEATSSIIDVTQICYRPENIKVKKYIDKELYFIAPYKVLFLPLQKFLIFLQEPS